MWMLYGGGSLMATAFLASVVIWVTFEGLVFAEYDAASVDNQIQMFWGNVVSLKHQELITHWHIVTSQKNGILSYADVKMSELTHISFIVIHWVCGIVDLNDILNPHGLTR